jgi:uncharacterized surface protein with fasciclin (FAS1) repeats
MKNLKTIIGITLIALFTFSCSSGDSVDNSISGIASKNSDLTLLVKALKKADLYNTLKTGTFTVLAPTNQAFIDAGFTSEAIEELQESGVPALKEILLNHVLTGAILSSDLTNNSYAKTLAKGSASSTNTLSLFIQTTPSVKFNGVSTVVTGGANVVASNGVVHVVDAIITLPTIVTHATANSNFSTLATLLTNQGLVSTLNGTAGSPFTVFAPLNSAFDTATLNLYTGLTTTQKTAVLLYHVVGGANVQSNAIPTTPITTLQTGTFTIAGTVITDAVARQTNIVLTDVQCSNGIIHAVNKVLLPF